MTWKPTKGTYEIDRTFPSIGRVRIRTGTHDKRLASRYETMLESLPLETVHLIVGGALDLRVVWDSWSAGRMGEIPSAQVLRPLISTMRRWLERPPTEVSDSETANRKLTSEKFERLNAKAQILDVPVLLRTLREEMRERGSGFNHHRAAALAFLRDLLGPRSELYLQTAEIPMLEVTRKFPRHPCTVQEARRIATQLDKKWGEIWWTMCLTGMGPKEYWSDGWKVVRHGLEIFGQKRPARNRVVPLVVRPPEVVGTMAGFAEAIERADLGVTPYDARRSYARWLQELRFPFYRENAYMGHGPKSMRELYPWGDISEWLAEDGKALRTYVGESVALGIEA